MKLDAGQFAALLQENSLRIASEYALFDFVLKWLRYDRTAREQHTAQLIERIRLPLLSGEELVEKVSHRRAPRRRHLLQLVVRMYLLLRTLLFVWLSTCTFFLSSSHQQTLIEYKRLRDYSNA